ncbi:hypothetical protein FB451DRAFT_1373967 [Mycena latifolia]|nr:hypothetical protein FB451DRAFT_1373967 [Mycena latifolia]
MSILAKLVNESYAVCIAQYARDDMGAGHEEYLHWALMVVTKVGALEGPTFHAVDRTKPDGQVTWQRAYLPKASLLKTSKSLGLVQIGSVKARDLKSFIAVVGDSDQSTGHPTRPKFQGWRCKDWVLEVIDLLKAEKAGWIDDIMVAPGYAATREMFLPALRRVANATMDARMTDRTAPPVAEWL